MKIKAINMTANEKECYLAVISAKKIFEHSIISRADEDKDKGYQRVLSERRAKDIAEYLNNGNIIPGCIILSAQSKAKLTFKGEELSFEEHNDSFFVIDGQHRLFGSSYAENQIDIPVYIFNNLTILEEVQYFLDVNSKQKGVPKTLRIELSKFLSEPKSKDEIRLQLFNKLNTDPESPLFNRLSSTSSVRGKITHVPFKDAIDPILDKEPMSVFDFDKKYKLLKNFLEAVSTVLIDNFGDSKRLTTTVFFNAIFKNFIMIYNRALMNGNLQVLTFIEVISPIRDIDFDEHTGTGKAADKALSEDIKSKIENNKLDNYDDLF